MACFHGGSFLVLFVFLHFFCLGSSARTSNDEPRHDLSLVFSRKELVQAAGYGEERLSSVLVTGTVLCHACSDGDDELRAWPVQGALVRVRCKNGRGYSRTKLMNGAKGTTDEYGDFIVHLPSHLHANPKLDQACTATVLRLPGNSPCRRRFLTRKRRGIRLSSVGNGIRTYTTGTISFWQRSRPGFLSLGRKGKGGEEERVW
ncbi:uncharacterized protein [Aristolochia californica]|uniref:uncharacterized protein n=1 Tax=Aristolochia californica TaxID=171875 RepID=UPI0035DCB19C